MEKRKNSVILELINLQNIKENKLTELNRQKLNLQQNLANPRDLNNNAAEIKNTERELALVNDSIEYAQTSTPEEVTSVKDVLDDLKCMFLDMRETTEESGVNYTLDIRALDKIIKNDIASLSSSSQSKHETSGTGTSGGTSGTGASGGTGGTGASGGTGGDEPSPWDGSGFDPGDF